MSPKAIKIGRMTKDAKEKYCSKKTEIEQAQKYFSTISEDLVKQRVFDLFSHSTLEYKQQRQRALTRFTVQNANYFEINNQFSLQTVRQALKISLGQFGKNMVYYFSNMPGFEEISTLELINLISRKMSILIGLCITRLFINNENYFYLSEGGIQYSRYWMSMVFGEYLCNLIFYYHSKLNVLDLSEEEMSILIPIVLLTPGFCF